MKDKIRGYLQMLKEELKERYLLSEEEAEAAVSTSAVNKMMDTESSAQWQMHQPTDITVDEIYCEYKGLPIPTL